MDLFSQPAEDSKQDKNLIYQAVLPILVDYLRQERSLAELCSDLNIVEKQAKEWLSQAINENKIIQKQDPVRFCCPPDPS